MFHPSNRLSAGCLPQKTDAPKQSTVIIRHDIQSATKHRISHRFYFSIAIVFCQQICSLPAQFPLIFVIFQTLSPILLKMNPTLSQKHMLTFLHVKRLFSPLSSRPF